MVKPLQPPTSNQNQRGRRKKADSDKKPAPRGYSLSQEAHELVGTLSAQLGMTKSDVVEMAIRQLAEQRDATRYTVEDPSEVAKIIQQFKRGAWQVAGGEISKLSSRVWTFVWPEAAGEATIRELYQFHRKPAGESGMLDSQLVVDWRFNLPHNRIPNNPGPLDQAIARLDLQFIRQDSQVMSVHLWFEISKHFRLLKSINETGRLWIVAHELGAVAREFPPGMGMELEQSALVDLGKVLNEYTEINERAVRRFSATA